MKVPRLGGLKVNQSCRCQSMPQPQQHQFQAASVTYMTAHGNAGCFTHWTRPGIEPKSSWILVRFLTHWEPNRNSLESLKNINKPVNITKKQTRKYREQTSGYHWGEGRRRGNKRAGVLRGIRYKISYKDTLPNRGTLANIL